MRATPALRSHRYASIDGQPWGEERATKTVSGGIWRLRMLLSFGGSPREPLHRLLSVYFPVQPFTFFPLPLFNFIL
jgi:hypothetical protein